MHPQKMTQEKTQNEPCKYKHKKMLKKRKLHVKSLGARFKIKVAPCNLDDFWLPCFFFHQKFGAVRHFSGGYATIFCHLFSCSSIFRFFVWDHRWTKKLKGVAGDQMGFNSCNSVHLDKSAFGVQKKLASFCLHLFFVYIIKKKQGTAHGEQKKATSSTESECRNH